MHLSRRRRKIVVLKRSNATGREGGDSIGSSVFPKAVPHLNSALVLRV